jgi:hypothetical protein
MASTRNGSAFVRNAMGCEIVYERSRGDVEADLVRAAGFRDRRYFREDLLHPLLGREGFGLLDANRLEIPSVTSTGESLVQTRPIDGLVQSKRALALV